MLKELLRVASFIENFTKSRVREHRELDLSKTDFFKNLSFKRPYSHNIRLWFQKSEKEMFFPFQTNCNDTKFLLCIRGRAVKARD